MRFHIITLFPEAFSYLEESIIGRAKKQGHIDVRFYDPRDYSKDKHRKVDGRPYAGGPGMVMAAEPLLRAVAAARGRKKKVKIIIFATSGRSFTNTYARKLLKGYTDVILIAGHYEGIDARVKKALRAEEVSIGPYVLTGGEIPAMAVVDAVTRQIEGVLGRYASLEEERISTSEVYTRPEVITYKKKKYRVPKVLLSGDHQKIEQWKKERKERDIQ